MAESRYYIRSQRMGKVQSKKVTSNRSNRTFLRQTKNHFVGIVFYWIPSSREKNNINPTQTKFLLPDCESLSQNKEGLRTSATPNLRTDSLEYHIPHQRQALEFSKRRSLLTMQIIIASINTTLPLLQFSSISDTCWHYRLYLHGGLQMTNSCIIAMCMLSRNLN